MKYILFSVILLMALACEKVIDMEIPDRGRRPVINTFIGDGNPAQVTLQRSRHILDNSWEYDVINNALVVFTNAAGIPDTLMQQTAGGSYRGVDSIRQPGTYRIQVQADGFTVTASTVIPVAVTLTGTDTASYSIQEQVSFRMNLHFADPPEKNYYMATVRKGSSGGEYYDLSLYSSDLATTGYFQQKLLFTDEMFNGKNAVYKLEMDKGELWDEGDSVDLSVDLYSLSYDAYMHLITLENQYSNSPFTEPIMVYSNVKEGYGIFAGYSVSRIFIRVPSYNGGWWYEE